MPAYPSVIGTGSTPPCEGNHSARRSGGCGCRRSGSPGELRCADPYCRRERRIPMFEGYLNSPQHVAPKELLTDIHLP